MKVKWRDSCATCHKSFEIQITNGGPEYTKYTALSYEMGSQDSAELFKIALILIKLFSILTPFFNKFEQI